MTLSPSGREAVLHLTAADPEQDRPYSQTRRTKHLLMSRAFFFV